MGKHTGVIIFYLSDKGYGYLRLRGTQEEFHFRRKNVVTVDLKKGDIVTFELRESRQGYFAEGVTKAGIS